MNTRNPFSTISYNSMLFLKEKLDELVDAKVLEFYAFIFHHGEDDEAGLKDHAHVYFEPTKTVQTSEIGLEFWEYPTPDSMPLKCIAFKRSQFPDWYLYGLHDPVYLASKNQSRKFHYVTEEMVYSDKDEFTYRVKSIDMLELTPYKALRDAVSAGVTFEEYFCRGCVPLNQIEHYQIAYNIFRSENELRRNGRVGHES